MMMLTSYFLLLFLTSAIDFFFFFNDTATTEIYTLSLHDALPISAAKGGKADGGQGQGKGQGGAGGRGKGGGSQQPRSEEHTSELQSLRHLVCRLLLEKKKKMKR